MKNTNIYSTITGGIINYISPDFTKADGFVCTTATMQLGISTYQPTRL